MEEKPRVQERRSSIRVKIVSPAVYTRFDNKGKACEQTISKSVDMSHGGVKLKSNSPVDAGEKIDITMALEDKLVSFKGKVVHATPSKDQGFEMGISIEEIENQDRIVLTKFVISKWQREGVEAESISELEDGTEDSKSSKKYLTKLLTLLPWYRSR